MPNFTNVQNRKYTYREGRETDVIHNEHFELAVIKAFCNCVYCWKHKSEEDN